MIAQTQSSSMRLKPGPFLARNGGISNWTGLWRGYHVMGKDE